RMPCVKDQQPVQTLRPNGTNEPFRDPIRLPCAPIKREHHPIPDGQVGSRFVVQAAEQTALLGAKILSRCPDVLMNQSTETIDTLDMNLVLLGRRWRRRTCRMRRPEAERSVRPVTIVMCDEGGQDVLEMLFVEDQ